MANRKPFQYEHSDSDEKDPHSAIIMSGDNSCMTFSKQEDYEEF